MDTSTSDPGDPIVSWFWDFDDNGNTSTLQNPTYTFSDADDYDVVLTITTQNGCTSSIEIEIETCVLEVSYTIGTCNSSGNIPVDITISDPWDVAEEIDIIIDGQSAPGSPFDIDVSNPVMVTVNVPGDGLAHTIQIQSTEIATCSNIIDLTVPDCNSNCFLSSLQVGFPVGTTHTVNVGDDFFSPVSVGIELGDIVHFNWIGDGHSTTSDATSGADSWNSGVISVGSTFDVVIDNPGTHPYYCIPHGGPGGAGMSGDILSNCPGGNSLTLDISFNTTIADPAGYNIYYDNVLITGSPFTYNGTGNQMQSISIVGDNMQHPLLIEDVADPSCTLSMDYQAPDCNQGGGNPVCSMALTLGQLSGCDASQNVMLDITVTATNGGSGFNLSIDGGTSTFYSYTGPNTIVTISLPGDGQVHTITVTDDVDGSCTDSKTITSTDCNLPCAISNLIATVGGNGNGGVVHTVNVQDFIFNPSVVNITVGDQVEWVWTGAVAHTSTSDITSGGDSFDSGLLTTGDTFLSPVLSEGTHLYYCIPHGDPGGVGMAGTIYVLPPCNAAGEVMVTVAFEITSNGTMGYEILVDGNSAGTFTYVAGTSQSATINVPGDNMTHSIQVKDLQDQTCTASTNIVTADCDGGGTPMCMIDVVSSISGGCDTNDLVPVDIIVSASDQSSQFNVLVDGMPQGSFSYTGGSTTITLNLSGDGQSHTIVVTDDADASCTASTNIIIPDCSVACSIFDTAISFANNVKHTVLVEDFKFSPDSINIAIGDTVLFDWTGMIPHTATSDINSGPNSFNSGLLSQGANYEVIFNTQGDHPYYCIPHGAPGGIGMAGNINVQPSCDGDQGLGSVSFSYTGSSTDGFNVLLDGILLDESPLTFNPSGTTTSNILVPGDQLTHTLTIVDIIDSTCTQAITFDSPSCSIDTCAINLELSSMSSCNGAEIELSFAINSSIVNDSINIYKNGLQLNASPILIDDQGMAAYNALVTGNGLDAEFSVSFDNNVLCADTLLINVPDCNVPCLMSDLVINPIDSCDGSNWLMEYSFNVTAGSPLGYNVFLDGVQINSLPILYSNPTGNNVSVVSLPGDGETYNLTLQDIETDFCAYTTTVTTGDCIVDCNLTDLMVNLGSSVVHIIEVRDFDFYPSDITIRAGETVRFIWTGDIPHTSTSDLISGIDSWNSGLLGNGDSFDLNIETPGVHGFYCIPHGGPGGIGQSGNITVLPQCQDGEEQITISFNAAGGSLDGFNLFVDGTQIGNGPFLYDNTDGINTIEFLYMADGQEHGVTIEDVLNPMCTVSSIYQSNDCLNDCQISGLDVTLIQSRDTVLVRDFDFLPLNLSVEVGDTIFFDWTGDIPHTVTSDSISGSTVFNSGLLQNGDSFLLIIEEEGVHPYYCIPHGGPGGVGMAGVITVVNACDDEMVLSEVSFTTSRVNGNFDVVLNSNTVIDNKAYSGQPINNVQVELPADQTDIVIEIIDQADLNCRSDINVEGINCNDPCFGTKAEFTYDIDFVTMEVQFMDNSQGNIVSWAWDFGDNATSGIQNPSHTYAEAIVYDVCLDVEDENGCVSTFCDKVRFSTEVCEASFNYVQDDLMFTFYNTSDYENPDTEIVWTFNNSEISTAADSLDYLFELDFYSVCIEISSDSCYSIYCEDFDLTDPCLAISPDFDAEVSGSSLTVQFNDLTSSTPDSWLWGFGDGKTSTEQNPEHTFDKSMEYNVCLFVQKFENNCSKSYCKKIDVGTTGLKELEVYKKINIYPNPSWKNERILINGFDQMDLNESCRISIIDVNGRVVQSLKKILKEDMFIEDFGIPGIFVIEIETGRYRYQGLIIKY